MASRVKKVEDYVLTNGVLYHFDKDHMEDYRFHWSIENDKVCLFNYSLLPGELLKLKNGIVLTNCPGSCKECNCGLKNGNGCYAEDSAKYHHNSNIPAWGENTMLAMYDLPRFLTMLKASIELNAGKYARPHISGEWFSFDYLCGVTDVLQSFKRKRSYFYSHRTDLVEQYEREIGFKENVNPIVSIDHTGNDYPNPYDFFEFHLDWKNDPKVMAMPHCPAVSPDGNINHEIKCGRDCFLCPEAKRGMKIATYPHGSATKRNK